MGEPTDLQPPDTLLHRATSNALWAPLRKALMDGWPIVTDWQNHDPRGNTYTSDYSPSGVPGVLPTYTALNEIGRVIGRLEPDDWPSNGLILAAYLTEDTYDRQHATLDEQGKAEWERAWRDSNARTPFLADTNRHGTPTLRRNHDPKALITSSVAAFLEALAARASTSLMTPQQEAAAYAALLTDDDVPDPMRPSELLAIAQRSGIEEPE